MVTERLGSLPLTWESSLDGVPGSWTYPGPGLALWAVGSESVDGCSLSDHLCLSLSAFEINTNI